MKNLTIVVCILLALVFGYIFIKVHYDHKNLIKESYSELSNKEINKCFFVSTVKVDKTRYYLYNINDSLYATTSDGSMQHINCIK